MTENNNTNIPPQPQVNTRFCVWFCQVFFFKFSMSFTETCYELTGSEYSITIAGFTVIELTKQLIYYDVRVRSQTYREKKTQVLINPSHTLNVEIWPKMQQY